MFETNFQRGIFSVIGSILVCISVGELNILGFLYPYFMAYFHSQGSNATMSTFTALPIIWVLTQTFSNPLGIYLQTKIGFRGTYLLFMTSFCLVQFMSSYITNVWVFVIVYGISGGISQGAMIILPIYCAW